MPGQVVDTPVAQELVDEFRRRVPADEVVRIGRELQAKSERFGMLLREGATPQGIRAALGMIFGARRRVDALMAAAGDRLPAEVDRLLHGDDDLTERFTRFHALVSEVDGVGFDLPAELLHFTHPDRHWLWTRWMWDPVTDTGALRLVVEDGADLQGDGPGDTYLKVGRVVAFVEETGKAAGFAGGAPGLLGTDVFLAGVYGLYMHTVLRMRMTNEFTKIVPPLPELLRRLLGVHRLEV